MRILFSEHEGYYRDLGLIDEPGVDYEFDGCRYYNENVNFFRKYDCFVCAFYSMPHNTMLTVKFKKINIKTVLCSDGIFEFANAIENPMLTKYNLMLFHPIMQDYFITIGDLETMYFSTFKPTLKYIPKRMINVKDKIPLPSNCKFLITTANTAYFCEDEKLKLQSLLSSVILCLEQNNILYSFRVYDHCLLEFLNKKTLNKIENDISEGFEETIRRYSTVISTPSSITVTAMYHQRSVVTLAYRNYPSFIQSGWVAYDYDSFESSLDDLVSLNKDRMDVQNRILNGYMTEDTISTQLKHILTLKTDSISMEEKFVNMSLYNMLDSKFNFNFEYYFRKIYLKFKKNRFIKYLRVVIR